MTMFALSAAALIALALWMLKPALRPVSASSTRAHLDVLREQLSAVDREHAEGQLDTAQHALARTELQRRVLDEAASAGSAAVGAGSARWPLAAVGMALPLFAIALYSAIGNPAGMAAQVPLMQAQQETAPEASPEAVAAMLAGLEQRLDKPSADPASDLQGWTLLGRSYAAMQRFADADRAFARAIALAPRDAQLLADRADVLSALPGPRDATEPDRLIAEALRIDPRNLKALALAGTAAFERRDFAAARSHWQQARALVPEGSAFATSLDRSLAEAASAAGTSTASSTEAPADIASANAPARIRGRVSLAPALAARAAPTDTVFVFARAATGSRMPLAIVRRTVADLPFDFTLDDSTAMSPQTRLSGATQVIVGVRVSRAGSAMPQAGDLRGESPAGETRAEGLALVIDAVEP